MSKTRFKGKSRTQKSNSEVELNLANVKHLVTCLKL